MDRLVDYFVVIGYDFEGKDDPNCIGGKIITRIPEQDWDDEPFIQGLELFGQPSGWYLTKEKEAPKFFVSVLTDTLGKRHYCAVLSFSEPINIKSNGRSVSPRTSPKQALDKTSNNNDEKDRDLPSPQNVNFAEEIDESMCQVETQQENALVSELKVASSEPTKMQTEDEEYSPKCLVLISRHQDFSVFRNCLGAIYTVYIEGLSVSLETVIANLLLVTVPQRGTSIHRFSIGAADKQVLQTPEYQELPITRSSVSMLLHQLGILNVMNILCAALVDQKLLFYSCSYSRLTESCNALTALMYPFTYSYPYIPILPRRLLECTSSPTPFLIGVHSSFKTELHDMVDVVTVDLDGGVISVPECITIPTIPEPYYTQAVELLTKVLCPDLVVADYAYPPEQINTSEPEKLDKEIRAVFLRLFCQLLMGYRSCLQVCRIHPRPIIRFQKVLFLTIRGYDKIEMSSSSEFMPKLLDSQAFSLFIQEEGPPYRRISIFDRMVAEMPEMMKMEGGDISKALKNVKNLAYELYRNERPNAAIPLQKVPKPTESAHLRLYQAKFPKLSPTAVQTFMTDKLNNIKNHSKNTKETERLHRRVPDGATIGMFSARMALTSSSRRLEVLRDCVQFIFEGRTLEMKKIFNAVLRALKGHTAREGLSQELNAYARVKPQLDNQQFDYIARLCNSALQACSGEVDEYSMPSDLLPSLSIFYRKLCPTVMQSLYTVVQEHPVWSSITFWEYTFVADVQREICRLYQVKNISHSSRRSQIIDDSMLEGKKFSSLRNSGKSSSPTLKHVSSTGNIAATEPSTKRKDANNKKDNSLSLEIAANELRNLIIKNEKQKKELAMAEEGVIVGQIQHISHRMIFMLVPLDGSKGAARAKYLRHPGNNEDSSNSYFTSSLAGSTGGSLYDESMSESQESDVTGAITKFVSMFVDRACSETGISADHSKSLLSKVPNLVIMQHESLHDVCRESKRLPPIKKAKLLQPKMLPGETLFKDHTLRCYLTPDGRLTSTGGCLGGDVLLPAEGAIFVTTYRLIFIGIPCDGLASEQVVIRSFPVSALYKFKLFDDSDRSKSSQKIEMGIQHWSYIYSSTFQLLLIGFDEEDVTEEQRLALEQCLHMLRNPATIDGSFAMRASTRVTSRSRSPVHFRHHGSGTKNGVSAGDGKARLGDSGKGNIKHGAKSLMKQAKRKAGMTLGKQPRLSRFVMSDSKTKTLYFPPTSISASSTSSIDTLNKMPVMDETLTKTLTDKGTIDQLHQRACAHDYERIGLLGGKSDQFKLTTVNRMFSVCRSYPVCVVVPKSIGDESVKSLAHCHHLNRFPAVVWMHPLTKAVLLRAGAIRSRTLAAIFKHGQSGPALSDEGTLGSSAEEERFLFSVISASFNSSPSKITRPESTLFKVPSNNSLSSVSTEDDLKTMTRGNNGFASSFKESRPESNLKPRKWGTLSRSSGKQPAEISTSHARPNAKSASRLAIDKGGFGNGTQVLSPTLNNNTMLHTMSQKAQLYVFGDKSQIKNMRQEQQGRVEFIPIDYPEPKQVRNSFKSLLKACLPVDPPPTPQSAQAASDDNQLYRKAVEESGWLQQVSVLISIAGAVVDVMDVQGSSVLIAMEDGWDTLPQLSSLAQVLLDPYYRTVGGFQTLVQKEWLSFGHRFSHRNHFNETISSGYTPIFLQFLDCVYQVMHQFPLSFEFNSTYLQTLAYHCTSNRFNTFLLDSDFERLEAGILFDNKSSGRSGRQTLAAGSLESKLSQQGDSPKKSPTVHSPNPRHIKSLWEYMSLVHQRSHVFLNTMYCDNYLSMQVLHSVSTLSRLHIWPYYTQEWLGDCPIYDGFLSELNAGASHNEQEATEVGEAWGGQSGRRVVNACYDNIAEVQPDIIRSLVQRIEHLKKELGESVSSWQCVLESVTEVSPEGNKIPSPTRIAREQVKTLHKKSTVDIIIKALSSMVLDSSFGIRSMSFSSVISSITTSPSKMRAIREDANHETVSLAGDMGTLRPSEEDFFDTASLYQFQTNTSEIRTYEGTLWKQGAYRKNWKQRFFVLDSTKHQLRQYESKSDQTCKNIFDLKEVESVQLIDSISGGPKGIGDKSFFELKTSKRLYHFIAESDVAAKEWIDVLQSALQG